jgi:YbbR domain-containing protein
MNKNYLIIGIVVILVIGGFLLIQNNSKNLNNAESTIELTLVNGTLTPNQISVIQNTNLRLIIRSQEKGEFHIAGYEIEKELSNSEPSEIKFKADKAGRYSLELHPEGSEEDIKIGTLLVNPH